jgi:hypothetical protein
MNCIYCQQPCKPYIYSAGSRCEPCNVDYWHHSDFYCANIRLQGGDYYNNETMYLQFTLPPFKPMARIVSNSTVHLTFDYMPNINPQNIKDKFKLYLLFS